ncbi:MAG: heparinase II/III family protein [Phycisphaeraceae bacterium]|nr:heparinase II/III family protein [Phycisphaeraceae bacterium]
MIRLLSPLALALVMLCACASVRAENRFELEIPNTLELTWPLELVHFDLPAGVRGPMVAEFDDHVRPVQLQQATDEDGKRISRAWFLATIGRGVSSQSVTIRAGSADSSLSLQRGDGHLEVSNGIHAFRLPDYGRIDLRRPVSIDQLPAPVAGMKLAGDEVWYGRTHWEGEVDIARASTEIIEQGPVFIKIRHRLETAAPVGDEPGHYEVTYRFVADDPWVDATETYRLPDGVSHWITLRENLKPQTVMWVPWFGFERFGGNTNLRFHPLEPQHQQRGPFVTLQPRWTQRPGGGQDFFVTRGGETGADGYDPDAPAVGVIATYPMKWDGGPRQVINGFAENGDTARVQFTTRTGGRSYALVVGERSRFDQTGRMNSLVRRHTDWTLNDQIHKYILEWERDPEVAGPHILISRQRLEELRRQYRENADTPAMRVVREYEARRDELRGDDRTLIDLVTGRQVNRRNPPRPDQWIGRRYQDDFLNPTTFTRRMMSGWPPADLTAEGRPMGGPWDAATGYIFSDLNHWPGYESGWHPGNPNFHTDKYMVALYAGAAMQDHPHAKDWIKFGWENFKDDVDRVFLEPDGVGFECPGYSLYSLSLQVRIARVFRNIGYGNPVADDDRFRKRMIWHRKLLTPHDIRLGIRHQAPIGDTHRWGDSEGRVFGAVAAFYAEDHPKIASELMGIWDLYRRQGMGTNLFHELVELEPGIEPMPLADMDWSSQSFHGFGSIMRSRFGTDRETFVSFKAGPMRGHYHNDELTYHFYGAGEPLSLDYNCGYSPRGDHAALHNSVTFGRISEYTHRDAEEAVPAMEQIHGAGRMGAFVSTDVADLVVAERQSGSLELRPIYPTQAMFHYPYPRRGVETIHHRRFLALVKHDEDSPLQDYLVVRDETIGDQPQQLNIHLLVRDLKREGNLVRGRGQWNTDALVYFADARETDYVEGRWFYGGGRVNDELEITSEMIRQTDGRALIPPEGFEGQWRVGEYQKWVRLDTEPGTPMLWVLYPVRRGEAEPEFQTLADGRGVRISLGGVTDEIFLNTDAQELPGQAVLRRNGREHVLLDREAVPAIGRIRQAPLTD